MDIDFNVKIVNRDRRAWRVVLEMSHSIPLASEDDPDYREAAVVRYAEQMVHDLFRKLREREGE